MLHLQVNQEFIPLHIAHSNNNAGTVSVWRFSRTQVDAVAMVPALQERKGC